MRSATASRPELLPQNRAFETERGTPADIAWLSNRSQRSPDARESRYSLANEHVDPPVAGAFLLDLSQSHAADLGGARHMRAAAGLQVHLILP